MKKVLLLFAAMLATSSLALAGTEATAVTAGSPLRTWLDRRRDSRPLPVLWGAGTSGRTATALTARF